MSERLIAMTATSVACSGLGAAIAYGMNKPDFVKDYATVGFAIGTQLGVLANQRTVKHQKPAVDGPLSTLAGVAGDAIVKISDVWSKIALAGYAVHLGMNGVEQGMAQYEKYCTSGLQNLNCFAMSMTNLSLNSVCTASAASICIQVLKLALK